MLKKSRALDEISIYNQNRRFSQLHAPGAMAPLPMGVEGFLRAKSVIGHQCVLKERGANKL